MVEFHYRSTSFGGALPVDIFIAVSRQVLAQSVEFAALANLPLNASSG
jgi:hypothetical protein